MNLRRRSSSLVIAFSASSLLALAALGGAPLVARASTAPGLGNADSYAVLAGTPDITNIGASTVSGSVGIHPAAAINGFAPCGSSPCVTLTNGTIEAGTAAAGMAKADMATAYGVAQSSPCNYDKTGTNLGGLTLTPGTYCQTTAPTLTGTLTLSGNGVFIFQAGSTLVTAPDARVVLTNGAQACNVFWQVSSSATLDTTTAFVGTILALTDITLNTGATIQGRALAHTGEVDMDSNTITRPATCNAVTVAGPSPTPSASPAAVASASPTPVASPTPRLPAAGAPSPGAPGIPFAVLGVLAGGVLVAATRYAARRRLG